MLALVKDVEELDPVSDPPPGRLIIAERYNFVVWQPR
jgi:hypothetical protein